MNPTITTKPASQEHIWVLGGGKFGLKSARTAQRINPDAFVTVVDNDPAVCRGLKTQHFEAICRDGVAFMIDHLVDARSPQWILPVIPIHVTYEWIRARLAPTRRIETIPIPQALREQIPNPMDGGAGELYMSLADFECPENCPEPSAVCTFTGEPRPFRLYEMLSGIRFDNYRSVVVKSHQLAPGVGGFQPKALFDALHAVESENGPVLLSTACSCHGVMHAFVVQHAE